MPDTVGCGCGLVGSMMKMGLSGNPVEVHYFTDPGMDADLNAALAGVTTAKSAIVELKKNPSGLNVAVAANLDGHWSLAGAWTRDDWGDSFGGKVRFSWG